MKVAELRAQGWNAIQGDVLTNGLSDRIVLSEGGAIAVNEGHHDELEIVDLLWRNDNDQECEFSGITDHSLDGWRPYFGSPSNADKSAIAIDEKPVFTQAMADNGEFPPVGSKFMMGGWKEACVMTAVGRVNVLFDYCGIEYVREIEAINFSPFDDRTTKQKAIDAAISEWPVADKATLELAYDLWAQKIEQ